MVTFVAQCEKKALNRTRRVLDAFANRIGNRTWQTVITNEGLQAVKKLLRKTATKNTAVSCHWIRSRSRSDLVWVVGSKDKFNADGFVPVNYTEQEKFIGEINMQEIYANTKKQPLSQHLFSVGVVAKEMIKTFSADEKLHQAALISGYWHDLGKLEIQFQSWLSKELKKKTVNTDLKEDGVHIEGSGDFSWDKYPTHNEVSTLLFQLMSDDNSFSKPVIEYIKHSIFWHHAKPIRKDEITKLEQIQDRVGSKELSKLIGISKELIAQLNKINSDYFDIDETSIKIKELVDFDDIYNESVPAYKNYNVSENLEGFNRQIKDNAYKNLIRTAVVSADRIVSSLSAEELQQAIDNQELEKLTEKILVQERGLQVKIKACLDGFEQRYPDGERNKQQKDAAEELAEEDISVGVLNGPAGCGKTKIALEWALNVSAKKILWICPRVQICQGLYEDLTSAEYLPNAKIEIHTGEYKKISNIDKEELEEKDYFTGDIVITTIDQIINSITTHRQISTLALFMSSTVVFDEFHEYIPMAGFNILFAELIECKKLQQDEDTLPNTLLVSATPNYYFVNDFLKLGDITGIDSFNDKPYSIEFIDYDESLESQNNPLYTMQKENTFVISNTAITAQKSFIDNQSKENGILTHSKFTPKDRADIFERVLSSFKENGTHDYDVLRSGPVIQAALNISCKNMVSEMTNAENFLQRLGRLNRFAENDKAVYQVAISDGIKRGVRVGNSAYLLNKHHELQSTKEWFNYLDGQDVEDITLNQLYIIYKEFYLTGANKEKLEGEFINQLKDGVGVIKNNIFDPRRIKLKKISAIKLKKHSLRGNSRFVQMAICSIQGGRGSTDTTNNYVADENTSLTLGVDEMMGYGGVQSNLLDFMKKKHHNITKSKSLTRTPYGALLNIARDPETPIYVSYTPSDLDIVNAKADEEAIYYAQGINQAIGVIAPNKLNLNSEKGE